MAVTESNLLSALLLKFMTAAETVNTSVFTVTGSPTFEAATAFPNGRSEKFLDFVGGNTQYCTYNGSLYGNTDQGLISFWGKPDFTQTATTNTISMDQYGGSTGYYNRACNINVDNAQDDWSTSMYRANVSLGGVTTVGQTWSANSVIHFVFMWHRSAGLDNSKSMALYINNVLVATSTATWSAAGTEKFSTTSKIVNSSAGWDGGIFDWAQFDYSTLAASYTDAEIVQALYSNTFNNGSAHKFVYELGTTSWTPQIILV